VSETSQESPEAQARTVTVLVVDDHAIWRGGVRSLLEDTEFQVIGEAGSGTEAIALAEALQPQLILLDIRMAGGDGLDALIVLKKKLPRTAVVMLTTYDNPTYMARAIAGGASGYLLKGESYQEFLRSLRTVASGESLLSSQELVRSLRDLSQNSSDDPDLVAPLSPREKEVLGLVATGLSNREIGAVLFVAESTVKTHVEHVIGKLGVSDRVQAAVWAARHSVIESSDRTG
jgi:DNA-binding NarL/FixJ family response regulator